MNKNNTEYLKQHGRSLIENGFNIIPIPPGSKSPGFDGWQNTRATKGLLTEWLNDGHRDSGVGILTKEHPAIDLDILDKRMAEKIEAWCMENIGDCPVRIGRAPRRLLLTRAITPFRKMKTGKYKDEWGDLHEVEILGEGQQFVAYALHKDTNLPYEWTTEHHPAAMEASDLPVLTMELAQDLIKYAIQCFEDEGWERQSSGMNTSGKAVVLSDDPFAEVETKVDLPIDEIRKRLMMIPGAEDHDKWFQIGMALYHQFDGDDDGLALWHEWSENAENYDGEALDKRYKSFSINGKKRAPITARLIIKLAQEAMTTLAAQLVAEIRTEFFGLKEVTEWKEACAKVKKSDIDPIARAEIAVIAQKKYKEITQTNLPISEVRKAISYDSGNNEKIPKWCQDWCYDTESDRFFHLKTKISMSIQGFNMCFSRYALTKKDIVDGLTSPSSLPADLAMNMYKIPQVYGRMYAPGKDETFFYEGLNVANTYPEYQVPETQDELRPMDKKAIQIVKNHFKHLLDDEKNRRMFLDWIAFCVQNPGRRVNWAVVMQGVEGDGKSFFAFLLRAVMGPSNVRMMNANILESSFTGWAHGQCVNVIEEPRLQGHNKYDVINRIKPFITNDVIEIHPKGKDSYNIINTTNYYLPTNFRDALPLNSNDRRFFVMFSRFQERETLRKFNRENPDYYVNLYKTLTECAGGLRKWLLEHEISDSFPAGGDAPMTKDHAYMVRASQAEPVKAMDEIIAEGRWPEISENLVNATLLPDALIGHDTELPQTSGLTRMLENAGYTFLGKFKVDDKQSRYWSKSPSMFKEGLDYSVFKIRNYIKQRKLEMENDEL